MSQSNLSGPLYVGGVPVGPSFNLGPRPGRTFFLSAPNPVGSSSGYPNSQIPQGSDSNDGKSWDTPFATLDRFFDDVKTFDRLYFVGDVREEGLIGSQLAYDVQIIGCGGRHHPDNPDSSTYLYYPGGAMIRPPASPTATTDLISLRGRGWEFYNVHFDCPVDAAAVVLNANALSGTSEYDAGHAGFYGCTFQQGKYGIKDVGGVINVQIYGCTFRIMSPTGATCIINTSTAVRTPQYWDILNCNFPANAASGGNECHIDSPFNGSRIQNCFFGTVESTALYVDLTGGAGNMVSYNVMNGNYATDDYVSGTGDTWYGNRCKVTVTTAPDGVSILVPAA